MNKGAPFPQFTVIINTYNRLSDLKRAVASIRKQTYPRHRLLVVDNRSTDGTLAWLQKEKIPFVSDGTKKLSYLFNLGWRNARTEYLAYLADDAEAEPEWLENIYKTLKEDRKIAVVGGPIISKCFPAGEMHRLYLLSQNNFLLRLLTRPYFYFAMEDQPLAPGKLFESGAYSLGAPLEEARQYPYQETDFLTTTSMGIRRSAIEKIGGFDENFLFNHADGDLFFRLKKAGYKNIFNPRVVAYHYVRMGPSRSPLIIGRDTGYFYCKDIRPHSWRGWVGLLLNLAVLNSYWLYAGVRFRSPKQFLGVWGFLRGTGGYLWGRAKLGVTRRGRGDSSS